MSLDQELKQALKELSNVSALIYKLGVRIKELTDGPSESFDRLFLTKEPLLQAAAELNVDSQLNIVAEIQGGFKEQEELITMLLKIPGVCVAKKQRPDGRWQGYITHKGTRRYVYGQTQIEVAKKIQYMIQHGIKQKTSTKNVINGIPQNFDNFVTYYFEKFRKKRVAPKTYSNDLSRYKNHLFPAFKNKPLKKITPAEIQDLLDKLNSAGKNKTAEELYSLLSIIFKGAISHGILTKNPLGIVYKEVHERRHGKALSDEELTKLLSAIRGETYETSFALMLYTGLRPNELSSVKIDDKFVIARNSKRKTKKEEYKKIPITTMLAPYLTKKLHLTPADYLRRIFKQILPEHQLYDLRHTFYSKCIECNVSEVARKYFVGHSLGALGNTYTHLSDNFLIEEGKKIRF